MTKRVVLCAFLILAAAAVAGAEATRTVRGELAVGPDAPFAVENLVGAMRVRPGDVSRVVVVATVHAEDDDLASSVRVEEVRGDDGRPTLRVRYPLSHERRLRAPSHVSGSSEVRYDGYRVRVSRRAGVLLYADVEVTVPRQRLDAAYRNLVGRIDASDLEGAVLLDAASGNVQAARLDGRVTLDTGSGDVRAEACRGELRCDTGSGQCEVIDFAGERLALDTGSGDVTADRVRARALEADTGSGRIRVLAADVEELRADTGSGGVEAEITGTRLRRVVADTGSGSVRLTLPPGASFDLVADQGSGDIRCDFDDARAITHGREVVGYRRGSGDIRITADTGSGDVVIRPGR
ncbi:MAG: DUF4097 domain-containing protein [Thermoanaerobaculaceae bacterium]